MLINQQKENTSKQQITKISQLKLTDRDYLPLQFIDANHRAQGDSISSLLAAFSHLNSEEIAYLQIPICKASNKYRRRVQQIINHAKEQKTNLPYRQIEQKISQSCFQVGFYLLVQASNKQRSKQLQTNIAQAFNNFATSDNRLKNAPCRWRPSKLMQKMISHQLAPPKQHLSSEELANIYHFPNQKQANLKNIAWGKNLPGEAPENLALHSQLNKNEQEQTNFWGRVHYKNQDQVFGLFNQDRRQHSYVVGKTGSGKSTLLANMIINDLKHNEGLAVIDPHGDLIETVLDYIPKHRINDTIILDPTDPKQVVKLNLFEGGSVEHRELIASGLVSMFHKLYGYSWGPRLEYILRNTLLTLLSTEATLSDIVKLLTNDRYRQRVVEKLNDPILKSFWENEFAKMHDRQRSEAIAPILNKVGQFVTSPLVRNVVNARHSSIDIEQIINEGKILLVNVSQGKLGEDNAALLGAMIITKLQLAAMNRVNIAEQERKDFYLHIDEFQNFATTSFVKILSEARKYRLNLTLANQYIGQIPDDVRASIFGNAGNIVSFIIGAQDAAYLQTEFSDLYTREDLVSLGKYQVICKLMIEGQVCRPFPAHTLPLFENKNSNREKVIRVSRERYSRKI